MNYQPEHELLSAYLDGELTAEEQARVETFLAENAAAEHLLDALRSASATVQNLPELRAEEDLSDRVLRRAERAILTGQGKSAEAAPASPSRLPSWRELLRRAAASRGIAWSAAALAIALLIMLSSTPERERDVARAPETPLQKSTPDSRSGQGIHAEMRAADEPRQEALPPVTEKPGEAMEWNSMPGEPPRAPLRDAPGAIMPAAEPEPAEPEPAAPLRIAPPAALHAMPEAAATEEAPAPQRQLASKEPDHDRIEGRGGAGSSELKQRKQDISLDPPVLVVQCDISPEAARQGTLSEVLADQQIAVSSERERSELVGEEPRSQDLRRSGNEPRERRFRQAEARDRKTKDAFDVVYVEATPQQVTAALDQLAQRPDQFLALSVEPAPGIASQQALTRFNRRAVPWRAEELEKQERQRIAATEAAATPRADLLAADEAEVAHRANRVEKMEPQAVRADPARPATPPSQPAERSKALHVPDMRATQGDAAAEGRLAFGAAAQAGAGVEAAVPGPPRRPAQGEPADTASPADMAADDKPGEHERYRVLFVIRVVPPELLSESPEDSAGPAAGVDAAEWEDAPTENTDDEG